MTVIAETIGKHKSTVSREIKRNQDQRSGEYRADLAQRKCILRHKECPKLRRFISVVQKDIESLLKENYSPEQIVGVLKDQNKPTV